jgi:hypothetical protein
MAYIPLSIGSNDIQGGKEEPLNVTIQFRHRW